MTRKLRFSLWIIGGLLLFSGVLLGSLNFWLQTNDAARTIEQLLSEKLAARVEIETPLKVRLVPEFAVQVNGLRIIGEAPGERPAMVAGTSLLSFDSKAWLNRQLKIGRLETSGVSLDWQLLRAIWQKAPGQGAADTRPLVLQSLGHISGHSIRLVGLGIEDLSVALARAELWPSKNGWIPLELQGEINGLASDSQRFSLRLNFTSPEDGQAWASRIRVENFELTGGLPGWAQPVGGSMQLQRLANALLISRAQLQFGSDIGLTLDTVQFDFQQPNLWRGSGKLEFSDSALEPSLVIQCDMAGDRNSARLRHCHSPAATGLLAGDLAFCKNPAGNWSVAADLQNLNFALLRALGSKLTGPSSGGAAMTVESLGLLPFTGIIRVGLLHDGDWQAENVVVRLQGDHSCQIGEFE